MTTREQLQQTLCDRLFWHTAERDDAIVAKHLFDHHEMDVVYAMDEATLLCAGHGTYSKGCAELTLYLKVQQVPNPAGWRRRV